MAALRIFARSKLLEVSAVSLLGETAKISPVQLLKVCKRWSTYRSSPIYKNPAAYTDYEVTNDPQEWRYVENLLAPPIIPEPPSGNLNLPSGWKPVTAKPNDYPYFVQRTKNHMHPVYLKITYRGQRRITHLRRIHGDIWELEKELTKYIEETTKTNHGVRINELIGEIKYRADVVNRVKEWLTMKGF